MFLASSKYTNRLWYKTFFFFFFFFFFLFLLIVFGSVPYEGLLRLNHISFFPSFFPSFFRSILRPLPIRSVVRLEIPVASTIGQFSRQNRMYLGEEDSLV